MMLRKCQNWIFSIIVPLTLLIPSASAETNIMFVLDVSGSMAQKIGPETKMTVAKRAFGKIVDNLPKEIQSGLYVYGHHGNKDCTAIENLVTLGSDNGAKMKLAVAGLQPSKGATPLTNAIFLGVKSLVEQGKGDRALVLISDGKETCGDDPIAFMTKLSQNMPANQIVKIYVIGLGVDGDSKAQLEKIATLGGGAYYGAGNEEDLTKALTNVVHTLVKTPIFEDDFSGNFLNESWQIINDDPDSRILEDGKLSVITGPGSFTDKSVPNLISYKAPIAEKNYDISVTVTVEATKADYDRYWGYGAISFGLRMAKSPTSDIQLGLALTYTADNGGNAYSYVYYGQTKGGKWGNNYTKPWYRSKDGAVTFYLRMEKRGFKYTGYIQNDKKEWIKLGTQLLLGKNLKPQLYATNPKDFHQVLVSFDDFKILRVEKK